MLLRLLALACAGAILFASPDPFQGPAAVRVLLFVRSDCPITNRYAPELRRIADLHARDVVKFWLVYPDPAETLSKVEHYLADYHFPGVPILDPQHVLVRRSRVTVAPEAAVFDAAGKLTYHGRIDDRWISVGKSRPSATVHDLEDAIAATLRGAPVSVAATKAIGCSLADVE